MGEVNNALSPHGGKLIERVLEPEKGRQLAREAKITLPIEASRANEIMSICYGFFSPLEGFMDYREVSRDSRTVQLQPREGNVPVKLTDNGMYLYRTYPSSPVPPGIDPNEERWWRSEGKGSWRVRPQ